MGPIYFRLRNTYSLFMHVGSSHINGNPSTHRNLNAERPERVFQPVLYSFNSFPREQNYILIIWN